MAREEYTLPAVALGTVIRLWRDRIRGMSQVRFRIEANLPGGSVTKYERGTTTPNAQQLREIARVLRVDVAELHRGAELVLDHLRRGLGPLEAGGEYEAGPPQASAITDRELGAEIPEDLRRRWERLVAAEKDLATERYLLEYETTVQAGRAAAAQGPP